MARSWFRRPSGLSIISATSSWCPRAKNLSPCVAVGTLRTSRSVMGPTRRVLLWRRKSRYPKRQPVRKVLEAIEEKVTAEDAEMTLYFHALSANSCVFVKYFPHLDLI